MYNVLIADDEPLVLQSLCKLVPWERHRFRVSATAVNGCEALEKLSAGSFHLVVTDIRMPVMEGLELIERLRGMIPELPVLVISGFHEFEYAKRALGYGVKGYVLKPVDPDEIAGYLDQIGRELDLRLNRRYTERVTWMAAREIFLQKLAADYVTQQALEEAIRLYRLHPLADSSLEYAIIRLTIGNLAGIASRSVGEASLITFGLQNITDEVLQEEAFTFQHAGNSLGVLWYGLHFNREWLRAKLQIIIDKMQQYYGANVFAGAGLPSSNVLELRISNHQAERSVNDARLSSERQIVFYAGNCMSNMRLGSKTHGIVRQLMTYVEKHFTEDICIRRLAESFYMNPAYMGQLFRRTTGVSVNDYLHTVRIAFVKDALASEDATVTEIIQRAGYGNSKYFYRHFKRLEGCTFQDYHERLKRKARKAAE